LFRQRAAILDEPAGSVRSRRRHARCRQTCGARSPDSRVIGQFGKSAPLFHEGIDYRRTKMPIAGQGMLLTSMDIDTADEPDFNRWYDREHLEERVAIEGFLEARRYVAHETSLKVNSIKVTPDSSVEEHLFTPQKALPQYLFLYSTKTIDVLDGPAYRARLN